MLAFQLEEAERCPQCGTLEEEWEHDRHAYLADVWRCPGCETLEYEQKAWIDDDNSSTHGLKFRLMKNGEGRAV